MRSHHVACCLGYIESPICLLISGGIDKANKVLSDLWLFELECERWMEVSLYLCYSYLGNAKLKLIIFHYENLTTSPVAA